MMNVPPGTDQERRRRTVTKDEVMHLINRSLFATIGYTDEAGRQNVRRVFCVWHKGLGRHLISTNTSSAHVQSLLKNGNACLYFSDDSTFEGLACSGMLSSILKRNTRNSSGTRGMRNTIPRASTMRTTASWSLLLKAGVSTAMTERAIYRHPTLRHMTRAGNLRTDMMP